MKSIRFAVLLALAFGMSMNVFAAGRRGLQPMGPPSKASELFYAAVKHKNIEMMDTYLSRGADINCGNCGYTAKTPLAMALTPPYGDFATVEYLVQNGADVNLMTQGKMSPLMFAITENSRHELKRNTVFLVEHGANVKLVNNAGNNALIVLLARGYSAYDSNEVLQMMQFLINKGSDVNHQNAEGKSALMFAAKGCGVVSAD